MALNILHLNPSAKPSVAILVKDSDVHQNNIGVLTTNYIMPLHNNGVDAVGSKVVFIGLPYPLNGKVTKTWAEPFLQELFEYLDTKGIRKVLVADSSYFSFLVTKRKAEESIGLKLNCTYKGYEHIEVLSSLNYSILHFNPTKKQVIDKSLKALADVMLHKYVELGSALSINETHCFSLEDAKVALEPITEGEVTVDIEATGLRFERDRILTIAFSQNLNSGVGIAYDHIYHSGDTQLKLKAYLKDWFRSRQDTCKLILHNGMFDAKFLIRTLFMNSDDDHKGMSEGISIFSKMYDTKVIAYLALNSTVRPTLGLKELSREFMGDYAVDVKRAIDIPINTLLSYNIKDCIATRYVYDKYYPMMVKDDQLSTYKDILQPSQGFLLEMMLVGLPISMERVAEARKQLEDAIAPLEDIVRKSSYVKRTVDILKAQAVDKYNEKAKAKRKTVDDFADLEFNPSSNNQLRVLLYDVIGFDVIETTDTGQPSTGSDVIKTLAEQAKQVEDTDATELLSALLNIATAKKALTGFISGFETLSYRHSPSGKYFLHGNLNLGATQSSRLSSSDPLSKL